jgi:hypothetical protein
MHSEWTRKGITKNLEVVPAEAKEAVIESIIAIWRLYQVGEDGPDDSVWEDHLEAWLVRKNSFAVFLI